MRIDIVTIFPTFFDVLDISLLGKARTTGLIELGVHDLRDFTHDRHRTVDDTPYGGGAGMVMKPEPWGEALDAVLDGASTGGADPVLIFPSPAGEVFTQAMARELAAESHLVFGCGRYEGIDQRVIDANALEELSIGDYVLSGGELAALVVLDAAVRLLPGVMGAADSATEESFAGHLLEYPHYTRPAEWQGRRVPDVLLSGHHAAVAAWRLAEAERITRERRPDLWATYRAAPVARPAGSP